MKPRGPTLALRASVPNPSESSSLKGHKAQTPIIAGSVCGSLLFVAWSIGLIFYLVRRRRKKLRARQVAAGVRAPKPVPQPREKYIIPPDPAVVLGQMQPGEHIIVESKHIKPRKHSKTMPETQKLDKETGNDYPAPGRLVHHNPEPSSSHLDGADDHLLAEGSLT